MKKYFLKKFPNGLKFLFLPSRDFLSFQVMILVKVGADYEKKEENGLSHFLEHMAFKGTKNRPSNLLITQELDYIGAYYNAFTDRELTGYFVRSSYKHSLKILDIISDIYLNPLFDEKEIEKEKGVIIEEINMYNDDPKIYVWDLWENLLYQDQPAGRPVSGTKERIASFTKKDFLNFYKDHYHSASTLIVLSGNFNYSLNFLNKVFNFFQKMSSKKFLPRKKTIEKQKTPQVYLEKRKTDQAHLILGVRTFDIFDKRIYPLIILDTILDGGMSALLFQIIREQLGAAYYVNSLTNFYLDRGYWAINMGVDIDKIEKVLKVILSEWFALKKKIDQKMLKKAKSYLEGQLALKTENIHSLAQSYGYQFLLKEKIETPLEFLEKIKKITLKDVEDTLEKCLVPSRLNLAMVGPFNNKEKFVKILKDKYE